MPTKKVRDLEPHETCVDPGHNPPTHMVYAPGVYEHTCSRCKYTQTFTVRGLTYMSSPPRQTWLPRRGRSGSALKRFARKAAADPHHEAWIQR